MTQDPLYNLADAVKQAADQPEPPPETITGTCPNCERDVDIVPPGRGFDFTAIVQCDHCGRHTSLRAFKLMRRRKEAEAARHQRQQESSAKQNEEAPPPATTVTVPPEAPVEAPQPQRRDEPIPRPRLAPCPACGRRCSDRAVQCMRCGHPLQPREQGARPVPARIEGSLGRINALATFLKVFSLVVIGVSLLLAPFTFGLSLTVIGSALGGLAIAAGLRALAGTWSAAEFTADDRWRGR